MKYTKQMLSFVLVLILAFTAAPVQVQAAQRIGVLQITNAGGYEYMSDMSLPPWITKIDMRTAGKNDSWKDGAVVYCDIPPVITKEAAPETEGFLDCWRNGVLISRTEDFGEEYSIELAYEGEYFVVAGIRTLSTGRTTTSAYYIQVGDIESAAATYTEKKITKDMLEVPTGFSLKSIGRYAQVRPLSEGMAAVAAYTAPMDSKWNGLRWGFIDAEGNEIVAPKYCGVGDFSDGMATAWDENFFTYIDKTGKEIAPLGTYPGVIDPGYIGGNPMGAGTFEDGFAVVGIDGITDRHLIDKTGKILFTARKGSARLLTVADNNYDGDNNRIMYFDETSTVIPMTLRARGFTSMAGFIDTAGKVVIPAKYVGLSHFSEGLAAGLNLDTNRWVLIDKIGNEVVTFPENVSNVGGFVNGYAKVIYNDNDSRNAYFTDKTGKIYSIDTNSYTQISDFDSGVAIVSSLGTTGENIWGAVDITGKAAIPIKYNWIDGVFYNGYTKATYRDTRGNLVSVMVDTQGKETVLRNLQFAGDDTLFAESGIVAVEDTAGLKKGFYSYDGKAVAYPSYSYAGGFSEGYSVVAKENILDANGRAAIADNSAKVYDGNIAGYINDKGTLVIPCRYAYAGKFSEGKAVVGFYAGAEAGYYNLGDAGSTYNLYFLTDSSYAAQAPQVQGIDLGKIASPTASTVYVNGIKKEFEAYIIEDNNYFKLRDLASALSVTGKRFEVGYDEISKAITLTTGTMYTAVGGEMAKGDGVAKAATPTVSKVYLNGKELKLTAYNINGNNFFKLRDLMNALDVYVGYDNTTRNITLDTTKAYTN